MPDHAPLDACITLTTAAAEDFEALLALRMAAMRDSPSNHFYQRHVFQLLACEEFDNFHARPAQGAQPASRVPTVADLRR